MRDEGRGGEGEGGSGRAGERESERKREREATGAKRDSIASSLRRAAGRSCKTANTPIKRKKRNEKCSNTLAAVEQARSCHACSRLTSSTSLIAVVASLHRLGRCPL